MEKLLSNKKLAQQFYNIAKHYDDVFICPNPEEQRNLIAEFMNTPNYAAFYDQHNFVPFTRGMRRETHAILTLILQHGAKKARTLYAKKSAMEQEMEKPPRTAGAIERHSDDDEGSPAWENAVRTLEDFV